MAKFYGNIGFAVSLENAPAIYSDIIEPKLYYGDVLKNIRRWDEAENASDNLTISNTFSIVADSFAYENYQAMRYVEYLGKKWEITSVEVAHPRMIINVGRVYNG